MATGTVKWVKATKGFGFIQPDIGGQGRVRAHLSRGTRRHVDPRRRSEDQLRNRTGPPYRQYQQGIAGELEFDA